MTDGTLAVIAIVIGLLTAPIWISFIEGVWKEANIGQWGGSLEEISRQAGRNFVRWLQRKDG